MLRLVLVQLATSLVAAAIAAYVAGWPAMWSVVLGAMSCILPNGLFALRLFAIVQRGAANPMSFMIGEFIKIALTLALLAVSAWLYRDLSWPALIVGMVVALKSYLILMFRL